VCVCVVSSHSMYPGFAEYLIYRHIMVYNKAPDDNIHFLENELHD
jgi:hypothetical protein